MNIAVHEAATLAEVIVLALIDFSIFLAGYGLLRLLHISVNWVTWIIGGLLIGVSVLTCIYAFMPGQTTLSRSDALLGILSLFIAVYAGSQWLVRQGYVLIKRRRTNFLTRQTRDLLLFLRKHHQFFGWLVVITAIGHAVSYLPTPFRISPNELTTGVIALLLLAVLASLGLWIETGVRKKSLPKSVRLVHIFSAIAFFIILVFHVRS